MTNLKIINPAAISTPIKQKIILKVGLHKYLYYPAANSLGFYLMDFSQLHGL